MLMNMVMMFNNVDFDNLIQVLYLELSYKKNDGNTEKAEAVAYNKIKVQYFKEDFQKKNLMFTKEFINLKNLN